MAQPDTAQHEMAQHEMSGTPDDTDPPGDGSATESATDDALFRDIYPPLRRFAAVIAPPEVAPDDLVQEAVARALRKGPLIELDFPQAYLRRTIANLASNRRRSWSRQRAADARRGPVELTAVPDYPSDLADLTALSARERGALYLHEVEGCPFAEVAQQLGCSEAAARKAASRGRQRLAQLLEEER